MSRECSDSGIATNPVSHRCPGCGTGVSCGHALGREDCWCREFPNVCEVPGAADRCLCPDCLRAQIAESAAKSS